MVRDLHKKKTESRSDKQQEPQGRRVVRSTSGKEGSDPPPAYEPRAYGLEEDDDLGRPSIDCP